MDVMEHKLLIHIFSLLTLFIYVCGAVTTDQSWYQGCYQEASEVRNGAPDRDNGDVRGSTRDIQNITDENSCSVVDCCRKCLLKRYKYAAVRSDLCRCHRNLDDLRKLGDDLCLSAENTTEQDYLPLPCGQMNMSWSVFRSSGPYIVNISVAMDTPWVVTGRPVVIEVLTVLASFVNISDVVQPTQDPFEMLMEWSFDDVATSDSLGLRAEGSEVYGRISHTFHTAGNNSFYVNVTNILSQAETEVVVNVIHPEPWDLEISLLQSIAQLPSCTPHYWTSDGQPFIRVFRDEPFNIEASVSMGTNLTFEFGMEDAAAVVVRPWDLDPPCRAWNCSAVYKEFVLRESGPHQLRVSVHNEFGRLQKTWVIFVVRRYLDKPTFTIKTGSKTVVTPKQPIRFLVALEITSRIGAILEVEFGDSDYLRTELKDTNSTSMALHSHHGSMMVVASYGQGCRLMVEFEHTYRQEGAYQPQMTVYSDSVQGNLTANFQGHIHVINRLYSARFESHNTTAVGQKSKFQVQLISPSMNVSYHWSIVDEHGNSLGTWNTSDQFLQYNFTEAGLYQVNVVASNIINSVQAGTSVVVQETISDLQLTCNPSRCIRVDQLLHCIATVGRGSNPKFTWKIPSRPTISPSVSKQPSLSMANYTFDMPGGFNISVQAKNDVSDVTRFVNSLVCVQEPVACVSMESYGPTLLGTKTEFEITVEPMAFVRFRFKSGPENRVWENVLVKLFRENDAFYVAYQFEEAGIHDVTVTAYNNVSSTSHSIKVLVMRAVPPLDVRLIGVPVVGRPATLQVIPQWPPGVTDNLEYEWHIGNYTLHGTGSTIITTTFSRPGYHQVNVMAANFVENRTKTLYVEVMESASVKWYLSHDIVTPVHQPVEFTLQGEPSTWSMLHVEYDGPRYIKHVVDATDYRWSQEFTEAGLYQTVVTMETANAGSNTIESLLLVQETITGLQLTGPQLIQMEILYKDYFWEAAMDSGTDVMYQWSLLSLSDGANITGAPYGVMDKYRNQFDMPGVYSLVVTTRNNVSQAEASLRIIVSYPVIQVTVETRPNPLGHTSIINITVTGADNFNVQVDFGDNSSTEVSTSQYNSNIFGLLESYKVTIPHLYTSKGIYKVKVNVSNQVSAIQETREVLVGEPITGITLHTTSPSLVQVAELVVVTATVATGDDLTFEWDFSDEVYQTTQYLKVVSEGNTSTANYSFSMAGEYAVSVRVSNVLYTQPFIVSLDFNFHVMEPVSQLTIEIKEKITGLPLQGSAPNISTSEVHFSSRCGGSDVMFEFDFGDGVTKQVPGILLQFVDIMEASYSHRYTKEGVYNVSVTARNSLSEMTSYLAFPFHVQLLPPQRLQLHPEMIRTPFGEVTTFTASVTVGTNFTFDWKFGDQSDIVNDAGPTVTHEYTQVGSYDVTVIAKNDVFQLTKTAKVDVLHRIQRVNLILTKSVVETNEMVVYGAETFPKNADVSYFVWNFGVQAEPKQSHEPVKEHMYTIPSRYTVTVSAHNHLSHVESEPELVYVQSPVSEYLEIRYNPKKKHHIVDENSSFSVYHFSGSNLNYTWDFGDGTENKTTKSKTMSHIYTSVGEYVIRVWAENMLSRTSASDNIFVLRKKCVKPELVIHGEFTKGKSVSIHVKRSKELYVEVELKNVDCDVTNATAYRWTFYNTSTGQEVELHTLNDDILRKKILRIPARVLPYGTYNLKVRVMVRETIVHSECQTKVSVDPTPLMCSIKGGVYRQVRRDSLIILDGTDSVDSDTTNQSSLRYNWTCYVDYDTGKPCFKENLTDYVTMDTSRIAFPGSILKENITDFMMKLTVMAQNREPVECTQMVHISDMLELNIYCPQCEQSLVNWDWPLSFQAVCASCDLGDLEYEWTMYMVPHLSQSDVNHHYDKFSRSCAIAGQTHISKLVHNNKTMVVNVDSSRLNTGMSRSDPRTEEESSGKTSTTTPDPVGLYFLIEDVAEGRSRAKENSSPITFQESRLESRLSSGRQRGSRNEQNILDILDIPHKEDNEAKLPDVDHTKSRPNSLDMSDIPQMDHGPNTLDMADIPQMDHGPNTLDMTDIPQMDHGPNTLDMADIPQMDHGPNTLDMADIPQMDHGPNTLDMADIPQMDHGPNTIDMADIPQMDHGPNTLDLADIPQMDHGPNTLDMADIPQMDHGPNTIDLADIPQMDHGSNTIDMADFPQMDHGPNTLDLADIPQMDHGPNMLDMADIPGRENSEDSPEITNSDDITNMADFSLIEDSHFNMYNSIIEENTRVESSRRKPIPHTDMYEVKEGNPGEEGSSIARNPAYDDLIENKISEIRPKPDINEGSPEQDGETPVFDGVNTPTARQKHILQHAYHRIMLIRNATLTGLNKRSLVLKPNNQAILQGFTYIMHVKATSKDGLAKGHAIAKFKVNQSPHQGDCSVKPDSGFEMSTEFTIFCKEWRDVEEHLPLWYEVSYNLEETDVRYVIYRGLQSSINFRLPAGNPSNNHRVLVYITILDSLSGRTPVCHAPLTVKPRPPKQVDVTFEAVPSPEEIIFYEAFNENGSIVKAQEQGYEHRVKVLVRYLATRLNQLPQYGSEVNRRRQEIRHRLLAILKYLPMRDELEVIQTLQALAALTQVSNELNQAELDLASAVFRSILDRAGELYVEALTPPHELLTLAVTTASNVISATVHSAARNNADQRWFYQTSMSTSIYTLDQLLKNELKFHAVGQQPIQKHAHYVETMASRFSLQDRPVLGINQSKFTLPKDMSVILKKDRHPLDNFSPNHDCFQVHMTKFLGNPYVFDGNRNTKVASEVGALKIYTCDGEPVEVSGLQDDNMVTMEIPRLPLKEETTLSELLVQHRLERTLMNLHQFNVSGEQQHQSLNIIFTLTPAYEDRLFPIALMIGFQGPPTPDSYLLRHEFDVSSLQAKLFLPAEYFNVTGSYYLGIVDGGYNSGRHRQGEATQRNYTLKIWWADCLFWNDSLSKWSGEGCWSTGGSTYYVTHCRCSHLTAFGSHFDLVPNELSFIPVEDFFSHHKNLTTVTLIVVILCLYAILMVICHRADTYDAKKGGITYLQDNTITDQQRFEVTVETGFRKGAGTTAKISLILHGEEGMSETRELITDDPRPLFERNSRDKFILTLPDSIGKIWKVQIWHNNSGQSPSWYLSRIIVKDLNNGNIYYFLSEKWLAVEEEDGKVEREFMALEGSLGVRRVFWAKGTQYMADYHLWTSLFTHPSPSHFTRTQRLTCCLTLLMMYMCLNAMWYKQTPSEVRGEFGLLDLSLRNVTVGAICCAVTIPVNLFLALLFRRSKKQKSKSEVDPELEEEKDQHYSSGKPDGAPQDDDDEDSEAVQPVMTYSILDQSILNWPSIQDWAQKQWMKRQHSTMSIEETTSGKTNDDASQQRQATLTPTNILHKRVIGSETDQASSGFEDSNSTDPRPQMTISSQASSIKNKAPSVSSSVSQKSSVLSSRKTFEQRWFLPYWFQYIAWTLCAIICLGCAVVTIMYGFRFGHTKGMMWLQSLYFSAIVCIFISHPLMICIAVVYTAVKYRNNPSILDHYEEGAFGEQAKLEILRRKKEKAKETLDEHKEIERGVAARQRSRYLRFARPPQEKQLIEARKKILKEKKAMSLISNTVGFCVMFILLCVMAFGKDIVTSPFYLNQAIKDSLVRSGPMKFSDISQPWDWYNWSQSTMLHTLYTDYSHHNNISKVVQNFALHGSSFVIGQIHLRQLRAEEQPCQQKLPHLPELCLLDYTYSNKMADISPDQNETWTEKSSPYQIFGEHGIYDNSGFVIKLDNSRSTALSQLKDLEYRGWISRHTRAVIVEFTLFNAPTNLFSSVTLLMEVPPTGGAFPDYRVMSTYLYRYMSATDNFVMACELFFVILTLYKLKKEACEMIKQKKNYIHNAWNNVQCVMVTLSLSFIACYLYRFMLVWEALESMRSTYFEQFVDISFLAVWDEILRVHVGVILFLVFIKSLRLLRYTKLFALFGNVYRRVHKEIIIFTALFVGLMLAFSSLGMLLFGSFCWSFHNYWTTFFTLMSLIAGHYHHPTTEHATSYFLHVFVFCFCVFFTGFLTSYVIAFLSFRYRVYRRKQGDILVLNGRDALLFYWNHFLMWTGIRYEPPVHEPENVLPAEFTMVEIEYQVDELFFRINALSGLHSLPEKPTGYLTDSDGTYGVGDDGISSGGSEIQQGEEERLDQRVQQIEDYLYSQEPYLAQLLKTDNTDPDLLSQEKEKQLKSHLEMEIFRQLQIQRRDTDQPSTSAVKSSSSQSKRVEMDGARGGVKDGGVEEQKKSLYSYAPLEESNSNESCDLDTQTSSSSNPESPKEHDKNPTKANVEKQVRVCQTDKSGSQSSDSDKGLFTKGLGKSDVKQRKPEPPPKPTFINHSLRDAVAHDASRSGAIGSPALRQLRSSLNTIERLSFKGDNSGSSFTTESSSGSEQDAIHGMQRPLGKQRNLRKTKSRGKGKGSVNLTGSLLDELDTEDKEELEQYEFEIQNTDDQVEQENGKQDQTNLTNKTPCDKRQSDKEPITNQETVSENKEDDARCSVKDSIKAFEKRTGNSS